MKGRAPAAGQRPGRAPAWVVAAVLLAHGWVLTQWVGPMPQPRGLTDSGWPAPVVTATFQVRQLDPAAAADPSTVISPMAPGTLIAPVTRTLRTAGPPTHKPPSRSPGVPGPNEEALTEQAPRTDVAAAPPAEADSPPLVAAAPSPPSNAPAPPTYRTSPPPSLDLHYDVRRGGVTGAAHVRWRLEGEGRYSLEMTGSGDTGAALTPHWTSRGALDADGIAPERFSVSRRGRERHAANFRRDVGLVSFAGPARTWPLAAGAQDRLSWMVQLAAVLRANPALAAEGAQILMMVVGAHGDAGLWTFTVQQQEQLEGPDGDTLTAWMLARDSTHAHDPQVQVWLAPALHHLPVRVKLTLPRIGESTEMHLRALQAP